MINPCAPVGPWLDWLTLVNRGSLTSGISPTPWQVQECPSWVVSAHGYYDWWLLCHILLWNILHIIPDRPMFVCLGLTHFWHPISMLSCFTCICLTHVYLWVLNPRQTSILSSLRLPGPHGLWATFLLSFSQQLPLNLEPQPSWLQSIK